jgi:hypothetical protein
VLAWLHVPVPEQCDAGWYVVPLQDTGEPQVVDADTCSQAPAPLQKPVLPQTPLDGQSEPLLDECATPLGTFAQVPLPLTPQDWQPGQLPVEQQTPSIQFPVAHSFGPAQVAPFAFLATQLPAVVALPVQ